MVSADEIAMLIETTTARYNELETAIKHRQTHDLPKMVALPASAGFAPYFDWILSETKK